MNTVNVLGYKVKYIVIDGKVIIKQIDFAKPHELREDILSNIQYEVEKYESA